MVLLIIGIGILALIGSTVMALQTGLIPIRAGEFESTKLTVVGPDGTEKGTLSVDVARSLSQKYIGLSNRDSLDSGTGLLFPYDSSGTKRVEMRNMSVGLDIIFVTEAGEITTIETRSVPSSKLAYYLTYEDAQGDGQYVIETTAGWCEAHDVVPGDRVTGLPGPA